MGFMELCKDRYSVRQFDARPVEKDKLGRILKQAAWRLQHATISRSVSMFSKVKRQEKSWQV